VVQSPKQIPQPITCNAKQQDVTHGETFKITIEQGYRFYAFGSSDGTLIVKGNSATLNTAGVNKDSITVVCSAITFDGQIVQATTQVGRPDRMVVKNLNVVEKPPTKGYTFNTVIAPSLSWTTGTQTQTIAGGSMAFSGIRSDSYCAPKMHQFGLVANASNTSTTKANGTTTNLNNNDAKFNTTWALPTSSKANNSYLGIDADFFGNNSLGVGLQQIYTAEYQYYLTKCEDDENQQGKGAAQGQRVFAAVGIGAGFINQRLYVTQNRLSGAVLPLSAQISYLLGKAPGVPPKLIWYALLGYLPVLTDMHAYQLSAVAGLQIPTPYRWLTVNLSDSNLYMNNAPLGFKRNYQNGAVSFVFSFPKSPPKIENPAAKESDKGACYGGDKLARLYCYDDVTVDACSPPNLFRAKQHCSAAGAGGVPINSK
jgi:hypothetical protein